MLNFPFFKSFRGSSLLLMGLLLSFSSFFLSGCFNNDSNLEDELKKQQETYLKQLAADTLQIKQHLANNQITNYKSTKSGLFYIEQTAGPGVKTLPGHNVRVNYTLRNLEGDELEKGIFSFVLGRGQVVPGFDEGVLLMNVGGKIRLFLPSGLAYGGRTDLQPKIKPNMILVFDVELLEAR